MTPSDLTALDREIAELMAQAAKMGYVKEKDRRSDPEFEAVSSGGLTTRTGLPAPARTTIAPFAAMSKEN